MNIYNRERVLYERHSKVSYSSRRKNFFIDQRLDFPFKSIVASRHTRDRVSASVSYLYFILLFFFYTYYTPYNASRKDMHLRKYNIHLIMNTNLSTLLSKGKLCIKLYTYSTLYRVDLDPMGI